MADPGVVGTAVGYMGGFTPPTYGEGLLRVTWVTRDRAGRLRSGGRGTYDVLRSSGRNHDPTGATDKATTSAPNTAAALYLDR